MPGASVGSLTVQGSSSPCWRSDAPAGREAAVRGRRRGGCLRAHDEPAALGHAVGQVGQRNPRRPRTCAPPPAKLSASCAVGSRASPSDCLLRTAQCPAQEGSCTSSRVRRPSPPAVPGAVAAGRSRAGLVAHHELSNTGRSSAWAVGSVTWTRASTRRSRLRCIRSAEPIQNSVARRRCRTGTPASAPGTGRRSSAPGCGRTGPGTPGPQRADAAHDQVDVDPGLAGPVERVDDLLVDDAS